MTVIVDTNVAVVASKDSDELSEDESIYGVRDNLC